MKKFWVFALAVVLVAAFALPAAAVESQFGGFWRTRMFTQQNFTGEDQTEAKDLTQVDTRTRIYYTAVFHDDLKFVNKFEFDAVWGSGASYGDIGADSVSVEVKNSYVDFNWMDINWKIGVQYGVFCRGLLFADDFAGIVATYKADNFTLPFVWMKYYEGGAGKNANDNDWDMYGIYPSFTINDVVFNPFFFWMTSDNAGSWGNYGGGGTNSNAQWEYFFGTPTVPWVPASTRRELLDDMDIFYMGLNADYKADMFSIWGTFIYETGSFDTSPLQFGIWGLGNTPDAYQPPFDWDIDGYLLAFGGQMDYNQLNFHGAFVYASGDSDTADRDIDDFFVVKGQDFHWAEILGGGIFDNQTVTGSGSYAYITNIIAWNIGLTFKPFETVTMTLDLWDADLAEDNPAGADSLGTEIDAKVSVELIEGLKLDIIGAYLFAGDAVYKAAPGAQDNDADPYEVGGQLSLSF